MLGLQSLPAAFVMRVFLRDKRTRLLYAGVEQWHPNPEQALQFSHVTRANLFAVVREMRDVEIYVDYGPGVMPLALPVMELERVPELDASEPAPR